MDPKPAPGRNAEGTTSSDIFTADRTTYEAITNGAHWIPYDYPAIVGYRAYLNPATRSGPSYNSIIPDRVLWFKLR